MKFALGSAQWGMDYGVSNKDGKSPLSEVKILEFAKHNDIDLIDTAQTYGDAESIISQVDLNAYKIISKLTLKSLKGSVSNNSIVNLARNTLTLLRVPKIYGFLVHDVDTLIRSKNRNSIVESLLYLKKMQLANNIGISVYSPLQLVEALDIIKPDIVQIPLSVFDQRFALDGLLSTLKQQSIQIHTRSTFLQGLLLMNPETVNHYFDPWVNYLTEWHRFCKKNKFQPLEIALSFVNSFLKLTGVLLGFRV